MNETYFNTLARICIEEFMKMYASDCYINKRSMDLFADKYQDLFSHIHQVSNMEKENKKRIILLSNHLDIMVQKHNAQFLEKKMVELSPYFASMFSKIDSSIQLDEEQKRAILIDEDYSLIVAGAGAGKTTTMAAKTKYLIDKCKVKPEEIILLSFTNKAVEELDTRINDEFRLGVEVSTFHKLGRKLLNYLYDEPLKIIGEGGGYAILVEYLKEKIFPDKSKLKDLIEAFKGEIHFDSLCFSYPTYDAYFEAYKEKRYKEVVHELRDFIDKRVEIRLNSHLSLNGEVMKSKSEVRIANFLYENGIRYEYEKVYHHKTDGNTSYTPDFTIYGTDHKIYVEYYGLTKYHENGTVSLDDVNQYKYYMKKKSMLHQKYQTDLIELYSYYETGENPIHVLERELKKRGVIFLPRTDKEIFHRIMDTSADWEFLDFTKLILFFISQWKEKLYQENDFEFFENLIQEENLRKQFAFAKELYMFYEDTIHKRNMIDFADMINFASRDLDKIKDKCSFLNYKYIIVDEYQDISLSRYFLIKKLSDLFQSKIVAVGDDWQSIFEFSGSELELFTSFQNSLGYGEIITITNTYRNSQELIDIAGDFISKNTLQFQKTLHSNKHLSHPIEIVYYEDSLKKVDILERLILKITAQKPNSKILLLGRFNKDIEEFLGEKFFRKSQDKIGFKENSDLDLTFLSVHKSKELGFDEVIVLNALNAVHGFPSKMKDKPLIALIKLKTKEQEIIEYPEERRLFYVALTRTKNKVYLLAPYKVQEESCFIKELKNYFQVLENIEYLSVGIGV